jgi:hypothetical protein
MAGTLWYRLKADHVYQRRFGNSAELAKALGSSHWYIISRRASVRIIEDSAQLDHEILTVDFATRDNLGSPERLHTYGSDFRQLGAICDFRTYEDGAYFSFTLNDELMHGDAWALASLLSFADADVARQEVLYVGQAFGREGSNNAWERTRKHEKLQRIYEDHVNDDCEIFVAPLSLERRGFLNDDHIDDTEHGPDLDDYYSIFVDTNGGILKPSVDLIEHAMISYFAPSYNDVLTVWRAEKPTEAMQKMRSAGFRLLHLHLSGWWGLARFYSAEQPEAPRSHFISRDFPTPSGEAVLRDIAGSKLHRWDISAQLVREGKEIFARKSEGAGVLLRVFGASAPEVRKPPGIHLPRPVPQRAASQRSSNTHENIRSVIHAAREAERKESEPIRHSGQPSYDPQTGTIAVGVRPHSDETIRVRLHDPKSNEVDSALIVGNPDSGKSSLLAMITAEAIATGKFIAIPCYPAGNNNFMEAWNGLVIDDRFIATGLDGTIANLTLVRRIINDRLEGGYRRSEDAASDIILPIDDADILLENDLGARLVIDVLEHGGHVGVGLQLVVSDITRFKDNPDLMYALVSCGTMHAFAPDQPNFATDLIAMYGDRRAETWRDGTRSFILHRNASTMSLGLLVAVVSSDFTPIEARSWCMQRMAEAGIIVTEWHPVPGDPDSWTGIQSLAFKFYSLRRHQDAWALVAQISRSSLPTDFKSVDMISWANNIIRIGYTVENECWQRGPTTSQPDSLSLYSDIKGDIIANDTEDAIKEMLFDMY